MSTEHRTHSEMTSDVAEKADNIAVPIPLSVIEDTVIKQSSPTSVSANLGRDFHATVQQGLQPVGKLAYMLLTSLEQCNDVKMRCTLLSQCKPAKQEWGQ